jgi:hypothetical protein
MGNDTGSRLTISKPDGFGRIRPDNSGRFYFLSMDAGKPRRIAELIHGLRAPRDLQLLDHVVDVVFDLRIADDFESF